MHHQQQPVRNGGTRVASDFPRRIVVAGSRGWEDEKFFFEYMDGHVQELEDEGVAREDILFISGKALSGADAMIIRYCRDRGFAWVEFPADWNDVSVKGALVRTNKFGKPYNAAAGHMRNEEMAKIATDLVLFWDLVSKGTKNMYELRKKYSLKDTVVAIDIERQDHEL